MRQFDIKVVSDFKEPYDYFLHNNNGKRVFERLTYGTFKRKEMFKRLKSAGLDTVKHGTVRSLVKYPSNKHLVVYTNEYLHCGQGKVMVPSDEAYRSYRDCYASVYETNNWLAPSCSIRHLYIGKIKIELSYVSRDDWRSNVGDVDVDIISGPADVKSRPFDLPLFAIDFVKSGNDLKAMDFNTAPGLGMTGVYKILSPARVAELIAEAV